MLDAAAEGLDGRLDDGERPARLGADRLIRAWAYRVLALTLLLTSMTVAGGRTMAAPRSSDTSARLVLWSAARSTP